MVVPFSLTLLKLFISSSSQCSTTGLTEPWYVLSCLWDGAYKRPLQLIGLSIPGGGSGFPLSQAEWFFTIIFMSDAI